MPNPKNFHIILEKFRELDYTGYSEQYPPFASWNKFNSSPKAVKEAWKESLEGVGEVGLFINVPFCRSKCFFCFLPVVCVGRNEENAREFFKIYFKSLKKEASFFAAAFKKNSFSTVYIGGGSPSMMSPEEVHVFFKILRENFNIEKKAQIIAELHPQDVNRERIEAFLANGLNRSCLGVQSMDERVLTEVKRKQNIHQVKRAYSILKKHGVPVNVDLIVGLPRQSEKSFFSDFSEILPLMPDQIHLNAFICTPYTLYSMLGGKPPDYAKIEKLRLKAFQKLFEIGYKKIDSDSAGITPHSRNFQTTDLWKKKSLLGMGPGAISHAYGKMRYINYMVWKDYFSRLKKGNIPIERWVKMSLRDEMIYYVVERLSNEKNINLEEFRKFFGRDFLKTFFAEWHTLKNSGATLKNGRIYVPPKAWSDIRRAFYSYRTIIRGLKNAKLKSSFLKKFK